MNINEEISVDTKDLPELITDIIKAKLTPNIIGSPGIGKSDIVKQVANKFNLKLIDFRLSQADITDLNGFPTIENGRSIYAPPIDFPLEEYSLPEGKNGWLLFLDELNSAPLGVIAASYKIILDRAVGQYNLHKHVAIVTAGNLATDKAIVNRQSTAMQSRLVHLKLKINPDHWIEWADENDVDYRVKGFIQFRPELLHKFDPNHNDVTYASPRTWAFLSKIINSWENISHNKLPIIAGTVGTGAAFEFTGFCKEYDKLPKFSDLINNPESIPISEEPSTLYAISSLIGSKTDKTNIEKLMKLINRLPTEFQVITLQSIVRADKSMLKVEPIKIWKQTLARDLL